MAAVVPSSTLCLSIDSNRCLYVLKKSRDKPHTPHVPLSASGVPASPSLLVLDPSQARGSGNADAELICARPFASESSMQPGIPNIAALMPHMPLSVQQLGNMTKPLTLGQRSSPASGTLQPPPMKDMPQVSASGSTQHAAAKPPGDVQVFDPHSTLTAAPRPGLDADGVAAPPALLLELEPAPPVPPALLDERAGASPASLPVSASEWVSSSSPQATQAKPPSRIQHNRTLDFTSTSTCMDTSRRSASVNRALRSLVAEA